MQSAQVSYISYALHRSIRKTTALLNGVKSAVSEAVSGQGVQKKKLVVLFCCATGDYSGAHSSGVPLSVCISF